MSVLVKTNQPPKKLHWVLFACFSLLAWLLFVHPDVIETANHSYLLLETIFKGRFFEYYNEIMAHNNTLYYINFAHYNIFIYFIFAIAQLPMFIINTIFHLPPNETLLYFNGKLVSILFFIGCIPLVQQIGEELGLTRSTSRWASLFFALWPPAFFSAMVMGQYDSIGLFFTLAALLYWTRGKMLPFAFITGIGAACKFYILFLFIPLLLLREKRIWQIIKSGLIALWLIVPTTLLFSGRSGDMPLFNDIMMSRLFQAKFPGAREIPLFPALYLILCFIAYLWRPKKTEENKIGLWLGLAAYSLFFLLVDWHPQWLILLAPFVVLTTFLEKPQMPWFWLDIALSAGFFFFTATIFPNQLEANLLDFGIIGVLSPWQTHQFPHHNAISFYYNLLPMVSALPMVLCSGAILSHFVLKIPFTKGSPARQLAQNYSSPVDVWEGKYALWVWVVFVIGMGVWALPTFFTWLKCFGFL